MRLDQAAALALAQRGDALGYDSLWVTHGVGRDALLTLSAYAHVAPRAGLGTGVIPIYPRHPVLLAQEALTLAEISRGRLLLGIGVSHGPSMASGLGLDMGRPLDVMREYVTVLRAALTGKVEHAGLGPKMLELAGEIAEGVVLWLCAPAYIRDVAMPAIRRGRERAGKSLGGFEVVAAVPAALTVERAAGVALFKNELTRYLALPFYRFMLAQSGFGAEVAAYDRAPSPAASPRRSALSAISG
jgi:alkanesulfonate monooxygenase SsuD/methylene tetrahydromethanopterin reductase-like flavin-dependent oxidoreductase (luciferase family)